MGSSYLFSLPLRGVGTADVESLSSYMCRMSAAHAASVRDIIEYSFLWLRQCSAQDVEMPFLTHSPESLAYYVRPNATTARLVEALGHATLRTELHCGTFLALSSALGRCMGTFDQSMRWCPACIEEFLQARDEGYFKLQWLLCDVEHCAVHGVELVDRCPHCERHQNGCARRTRCTHCVYCDQPLSGGVRAAAGPGSWSVESADLLELVEEIASDVTLHYPAEGPRVVLSELFDRAWKREDELRLWKVIPRDECLSIVDGTTPVSLRTARRLSYRLGVRLIDLLAGTLAPTTAVLDISWTEKLPRAMRPKRRRARRDRARLRAALEDALRDGHSGKPIALRTVATKLGVSSGCLNYHFPETSRQLLKLHAAWRQAERARKMIEARAAVLEYLVSHDSDREISRKGMLRALRARTKLPKDVLRLEIAKHA
jgi:hypothetical protein